MQCLGEKSFMLDIKKYEAILQGRLKELGVRLHGIEDRLDEPVDDDAEERATEREEDEVLEKLGVAGQTEIEMIEAALRRIQEGTFGNCMTCGVQISDARLEILPHTTQCKLCVRQD